MNLTSTHRDPLFRDPPLRIGLEGGISRLSRNDEWNEGTGERTKENWVFKDDGVQETSLTVGGKDLGYVVDSRHLKEGIWNKETEDVNLQEKEIYNRVPVCHIVFVRISVIFTTDEKENDHHSENNPDNRGGRPDYRVVRHQLGDGDSVSSDDVWVEPSGEDYTSTEVDTSWVVDPEVPRLDDSGKSTSYEADDVDTLLQLPPLGSRKDTRRLTNLKFITVKDVNIYLKVYPPEL